MKKKEMLLENLPKLEKTIGYEFKDKDNIFLALTHSSYANENKDMKISSNERIEFLGDSILSLSISELLYKTFKNLAEGELTKVRANIVCEQSLHHCALGINLSDYLFLGKGEEITGGRQRAALLADAFEALIGAIYLDSGLDEAKKFIYTQMQDLINQCANGKVAMDYKTQLQEIVQSHGDRNIFYKIVGEDGPDHNKHFISQVIIDDEVVGSGRGKSKKEAEQNAAKEALGKKWN